MRRSEIEAWAHRVLSRVRAAQQREDGYADLKAAWPTDHAKCARQIAGLCNAARGEPVLWLIGVDENRGVIGVPAEELSEWWGKVRAGFAGQVPTLQDAAITLTDGPTIVALVFDTEAAPFVVRNPLAGKPGGGAIDREVPWREGTATRSATREELLQILVPVSRLPRIEIRSFGFQWQPLNRIDASLLLYVVPPVDSRTVLPRHRAELRWESAGRSGALELAFFSSRVSNGSPYVTFTSEEAIFSGPGSVLMQCQGDVKEPFLGAEEIAITASLYCAIAEQSVHLHAVLTPRAPAHGQPGLLWQFHG